MELSTAFVEEIATLYELSLTLGQSLDPASNARSFADALASHKDLDAVVIWTRADEHTFSPLYTTSSALTPGETPSDHPMAEALQDADYMTVHAGDPAFARLASGRPVQEGAIAAIRLSDDGFIELYDADREEAFSEHEIRQLDDVLTKLCHTLRGAHAHQRLQTEIRERKRAESRLATLIQNLQDAILVENEDRELILVNQAFCDLFSIPAPPEALVGADCGEAAEGAKELFEDPDAFVHDIRDRLADRERVIAEPLRMTNGGRLLRDFVPVRLDDGTYLGHLWRYQDVTDQRRVQNQLQHRLDLEHIIVDVSTTFIKTPGDELDDVIESSLGTVGQFVDVDRSYVFLIDDEAATMSNTHEWCADEISPEKENLQNLPVDALPWWMAQMRANTPMIIPSVADMPEAAAVEKEILEAQEIQSIVVVPMTREDRLVGFVGFDAVRRQNEWDPDTVMMLRVLSDAIANALQRRAVESALRRAKQEAEAASHAKSSFLANVSHEIRTPMNGVIGMTSLLMETGLDDQQQQYVETIRTSGDTLLTLINDVLDFSKIEAGRLELDIQPISVQQAVEDVVDLVASQAAEKHLDLAFTVEPDAPRYVRADAARLRQVLLNLASNAVKFTSEGEVTIHVRSTPNEDGTEALYFDVRDTGIGIEPAQSKRLFDVFTQADASMTRQYGGTGLGLSISRKLTGMMGGTVTVESSPGEGSVFTASISTRRVDPSEMPDIGSRETLDVIADRRVLLVGAPSATMTAARSWLMRWNARVQHAADGPTAFAQLTSGDAVDLVVYDTPRSDEQAEASVEATVRMLRASGTPVLALLPLHAHASRLDGGGALRKPLRPSRFARALARMLNGDADRSGLVPREEVPVDAAGRKLRVLVVEDNAVNQRVMEQMMTRLGHRPDLVSNGLEAVAALKRQAYDLVFMDLQMPELDGISATRRIRAMETIDQPRIVALTAGAMEGTRERCLDAGMDDYLAKPIRLDDLRPVLTATPVLDAGDDDSGEALRTDVLSQLSRDVGAKGPDDPFVQELVEQFIEQANYTLETMQTLSATNRYAELAQEAHRLKGGARTIGAEAFARACALLEAQAEMRTADPEAAADASLAEHVETLATTLAAVRAAANNHFAP